MAELRVDHVLLEEVRFISPFVLSKPISHLYETERSLSPSSEFKPVPLAQCFTLNLLKKRTFVPWTFLVHQLWNLEERIPQISMQDLNFLTICAHIRRLQSPSRLALHLLAPTDVTTGEQRWRPQTPIWVAIFHEPRINLQAHGIPL